MKVHILYPFKNGPWGGANQFLHAVKNILSAKNVYCEIPEQADILLFNLNPSALLLLLSQVEEIKKKYPNKILVVRIDGPVFLIRDKDLELDHAFFDFTHGLADGTIFQSHWSRQKCFELGMKKNVFQTTILNAPDPAIFSREGKIPFSTNRKIRLIATSWSANWKKGFAVYKWLDEHLDFSRYEMTFVGNSPTEFNNIRHIQPLPSKELALELKKSDIFVTASQKDPCSNSLIEAMHCGLPAIVLNDGGHPEIVGQGGKLFETPEEIPALLEKITDNYERYQDAINLPTMEEVGQQYLDFMQGIYTKVQQGEYAPKRLSFLGMMKIRWMLIWWKVSTRWDRIKKMLSVK